MLIFCMFLRMMFSAYREKKELSHLILLERNWTIMKLVGRSDAASMR